MGTIKDSYRLNLREVRARMFTNCVLRALDDHLPYSARRAAHDALMDMFSRQGFDVVTDQIRAEAKLPPRGPEGYTLEELVAIEKAYIDHLLRPVEIKIPINGAS